MHQASGCGRSKIVILKNFQNKKLHKILSSNANKGQKLDNNLSCLNPFVDKNGLIRVGGRLKQSNLEEGIIQSLHQKEEM